MSWGVVSWAQTTWSQLLGSDPLTSAAANRLSAFNFCDPFDHILPFADGTVSALDRQHLWGLYSGIAAASPIVSAVVTGTAIAGGVLESEIVAGGETIIITLANDTWVASGATFNAQRQAIIDGLDSDGIEVAGWNAEVRDKEVVGAVIRTSDTVVTITLTAAAAYAVDSDETITATLPAAAMVTTSSDLEATPTFDVTAQAEAAEERNRGGWLSPEQVKKLRLIAKDAEQRQQDRSRRNKQRVAKRRAELEGIFNEIHGIIPESAAESIAEAVRPFSASTDARVPPPVAIDFKALLDSAEATAKLATALARISQERNEDETMVLLMMAA